MAFHICIFQGPLDRRRRLKILNISLLIFSSLVIQLAKRDGMKVVASAGTDDKVQYMKEIGADIAFNYKTTSTKDILERHGPINVYVLRSTSVRALLTCHDSYWDNVGGEVLDLALEYAAESAIFVECGMITAYNSKEPYPFKVLMRSHI